MKVEVLAKATTPEGRTYRLQRRGSKFDVAWQDAYTWKYVSGGKGLTEASARALYEVKIFNPNKNPRGGKFDRCVAEVRRSRSVKNPYAVCASTLKAARRRRNPRKSVMRGVGMFRLIAKRGNTRLVYVGGGKFSHHGEPVYFRSIKSAELTARWLLRSFVGLKGFTFHAVSNS